MSDLHGSKFNRDIVPVPEAVERVLKHAAPCAVEHVALEQAMGRRLAEPLVADAPVPHFRRSGMDGYAVRAEETKGATAESPARLKVVAHIPCGAVMDGELQPGQAARIMTGSAVPEGADAVIMLEQTDSVEQDGKTWVQVKRGMAAGANISEIGLEVRQGERLLEPGRLLGAGEIALLAMFGVPNVPVYRAPRVAVFATGTELLRVEDKLAPGKIRNSNGYMLAAQVREAGGIPVLLGAIPDEMELARTAILSAMEEYDAVITTGGVSVGDYDILYDLTSRWDGELLFNKVAMRPGSPTTVSIRQGKLLFALSGNPGACFVGCELFVRPALLAMQGASQPGTVEFTAVLAADYMKLDKFTKYLRGVRRVSDQGMLLVEPVGLDASSITVSIRDADCLIVIPPADKPLLRGTLVRAIPLGGWGGQFR